MKPPKQVAAVTAEVDVRAFAQRFSCANDAPGAA